MQQWPLARASSCWFIHTSTFAINDSQSISMLMSMPDWDSFKILMKERELDCWRVIQITKWLEAIVREEECVSAIGELGFIYLSLVQTVPSVRKANGLYYYFTFHTPPSLPLNKAVILWISFILQGYQRYSVLTWFYLYTNIGGSNTFQSLLNKQIILLQWGIKILIFLLVSSRRNQL